MCHGIYHFEACKNGNRKQRLLIVRDERKFPADEDSQRDDEDESAEEVADDRKWMSPLSRRGDASDAALRADGHANDDEQDDIHADVGEQGNLFTRYADKGDRGEEDRKPDDGGCNNCGLCDCFHGLIFFPPA